MELSSGLWIASCYVDAGSSSNSYQGSRFPLSSVAHRSFTLRIVAFNHPPIVLLFFMFADSFQHFRFLLQNMFLTSLGRDRFCLYRNCFDFLISPTSFQEDSRLSFWSLTSFLNFFPFLVDLRTSLKKNNRDSTLLS